MGAYHEKLTRSLLRGGRPAEGAKKSGGATKKAPARKQAEPAPQEELRHPGEILGLYLADLGLTASDVARDIGVPVNRVTGIINGQRGVTADTALRLAHWFGVAPEDWLELQTQYDLTLARREIGAKMRKMPRLSDRLG